MRPSNSLALAMLALVLLVAQADAQAQPCYHYPAIAMTANVPSIQEHAFDRRTGSVTHHDNSTHDIVLFAPVIDNSGTAGISWNTFGMRYRDSDGFEPNAQVKASLISVGPKGKIQVIATLDSNTESAETTVRDASVVLNHEFNFVQRYYFVRVTVSRKSTQQSPEIIGIKLCHTVF